MKKHFIIVLFQFIVVVSFSQNLVQNSSFEVYDTCPTFVDGSLKHADNWMGFFHRTLYNKYPKPVPTLELFHTCGNIPNLITGNKKPRTGNGMSGFFFLFCDYNGFTFSATHNEWLTAKLKDTLKKDTNYYASFYVRKVDTYNTGNSVQYNVAINTFTATFTGDTLIGSYDSVQNWWPPSQVVYNDTLINDTVQWSKISGSFKAKGDEAYFTIGAGLPISQIQYYPDSTFWNLSYYTIDDVAVWNCSVKAKKADAGPDHEICQGQEVKLGTHDLNGYRYYWYVGADTGDAFSRDAVIHASPAQSSMYILKVKDWKYEESYDTVLVTVDKECMDIEIPNVITPNGDGYNDYFDIVSYQDLSYEVSIFNRWGKLVYRGNQENPWDGTQNGSKVAVGAYYYVLRAKNETTGYVKKFSGSITVLY